MDIKKSLSGIQKNISLRDFTTFKIGGRAKYFFIAKTKENLLSAVLTAKKFRLPFFILGGGSNVLISDKGYAGLVIKIKNQDLKIEKSEINAEAGVPLGQLLTSAAGSSLTGLEWVVGIPGTVGGAVYGNAGGFGKSMKDTIKEVEVLDLKDLKIERYGLKDCKFSYRESIFKKNKNLIIISVIFKLRKLAKSKIGKKIKEYSDYRKEHQPLNLPSAGSVFKNPPGFSAGALIEKCGLKGKKIGDVKISEKHANFIVNLGNGRSKDVKKLISLAKTKVKDKFKINLEEEIQYL
ncbi:MAG: UDP-N-acetylmuramate dehydrogenase [Candidatus Paceibacterota bacterium]